MKNMLGVAVFIIALLAVSTPAAAASGYDADFALATKSASSCPTGTTEIMGILKNTGGSADRYLITADSDWVTVAPDVVELQPGQQASVYAWVRPSKDAVAGEYEAKVTVKSKGSGSAYHDTMTIDVLACHAVDIEVEPGPIEGCIGEDVAVSLSITNNGKAAEEFEVCATAGTLDCESPVEMGAGETRDVTLTVPLRQSSEKVTIEARSITSYAKDTETITIVGDELCYSVAVLAVPPQMTVCQGATPKFVISVKNVGARADAYSLEATIEGRINDEEIALEPGQAADTYIEISTAGMKPAEYQFTITASSTSSEDSETAVLTVENCWSAEASLVPAAEEVCPGRDAEFIFSIKNTGKNDDTYELSSAVGVLDDKEVSIEAGEEANTTFSVRVNMNTTGNFSVSVSAASSHASAKASAAQAVKTLDECYATSLSVMPQLIGTEEGGGLYKASVRNDGLYASGYSVAVDGPEWVHVNPRTINLGPGEAGDVYVFVSPEYGVRAGEYGIEVIVADERGIATSQSFIFKVPAEGEEPGVCAPDGICPAAAPEEEFELPEGLGTAVALGILVIILIVFGPDVVKDWRPKAKKPASMVRRAYSRLKAEARKRKASAEKVVKSRASFAGKAVRARTAAVKKLARAKPARKTARGKPKVRKKGVRKKTAEDIRAILKNI